MRKVNIYQTQRKVTCGVTNFVYTHLIENDIEHNKFISLLLSQERISQCKEV
jgi:hypothetical protein